jgi:hypothetical protein
MGKFNEGKHKIIPRTSKKILNKHELDLCNLEPQVLLDGMQLNSKLAIKIKISSLREELALVRLT